MYKCVFTCRVKISQENLNAFSIFISDRDVINKLRPK